MGRGARRAGQIAWYETGWPPPPVTPAPDTQGRLQDAWLALLQRATHSLKSPDAALHNHVLDCFERAQWTADPRSGGACSASSSSGAARTAWNTQVPRPS